jgi:uncharacterized membrane protein
MSTCLLAVEGGPSILHLLGRLHPAVVHFPIALIAVAAVLEAWQIIRRKPGLASATPVCLILGAVSAVMACLFGWWLHEFEGGSGRLAGFHKWIGITSTVAAVTAAVLVCNSAGSPRARATLRLTLFLGAGLVTATGYLGGELVFGSNHLFKGILDEKPPRMIEVTQARLARVDVGPDRADMVDFAKEVAPILRENCLRCHGGDKVKSKFNLKTKASAMKGGAGGRSILPGQPAQSPLYTLLVESDIANRMPPPKERPLSRKQIELIRMWLEQGAHWPESVELD